MRKTRLWHQRIQDFFHRDLMFKWHIAPEINTPLIWLLVWFEFVSQITADPKSFFINMVETWRQDPHECGRGRQASGISRAETGAESDSSRRLWSQGFNQWGLWSVSPCQSWFQHKRQAEEYRTKGLLALKEMFLDNPVCSHLIRMGRRIQIERVSLSPN